MTTDIDYPEIPMPEAHQRWIAAALERIATALEQLVLQNLPSPSNPAPAQREPAPWDNVPLPVTPLLQQPYTVVSGSQPYQPMVSQVAQHPAPVAARPLFRAGDVHTQGHNPLKENSKGLFCPTKLTTGLWCDWRAPK